MRQPKVRAIVVLLLLAVAVVLDGGRGPAIAAEATLVETGWWSTAPSTTTPEGGFVVSKSVEGPTAVSALRIQYEGPLEQALLVLIESTGGYLKEGAVIEACPTTAEWTATVAGPMEQAPAADCTNKISLQRDPVTGSWTADLVGLMPGDSGTVSLLLTPGVATSVTPPAPPTVPSPVPLVPVPTAPPVPVPPVETPVDPGFSVEFVRGSLQASGPAEPFDDGSSSSTGSGTIASDFGGSSSSGFAPTFTPTDSFATSSAPSLTPARDVLPSATPDVAATGAGGVGTAASVESGLQPVAATRGPATPWGRLVLLLPLSALLGAAGAFARRTFLGRSSTAVA